MASKAKGAVAPPQESNTAVIPFDRSKLAAELKQAPRPVAGAMPFLSMDKAGDWSFGVDRTPIKNGALLAVNPGGFVHGLVAWADTSKGAPAAKLGEHLLPVSKPLPDPGAIPPGARGWEAELGAGLKMLEDGTELLYATTSVGGKRAVLVLRDAVVAKLTSDDPAFVPVVKLESSTYKHRSYGIIHNPVFAIQKWVTMQALEKGETKALPAKGKRGK